MVDIELAIKEMAKERFAFHSEGDLKYTLAQSIANQTLHREVRLEYPTRLLTGNPNDGGAIDIWLKDHRTAIELKYKTVPLPPECDIQEEEYEFKRHRQGRYGFLNDIHKLETIVDEDTVAKGYVLLITNDEGLWSRSRSKFSLHKEIPRDTIWNSRGQQFQIRRSYTLTWKSYSECSSVKFKYLLVEVEN